MPLKLMYITNRPEIAQIVENAGVDRVFVDMEYIGKSQRQHGMDTVQCHHTIDDVKCLRKILSVSELLVRINPIHDACNDYGNSEEEIENVLQGGADVLMLPYFKTSEEALRFVDAVDNRAKKILLLETPEAVENLDSILSIEGIDEIHIGLNDLSLGYGKKFMFELLSDGTVERLCCKISEKGITYGFGGIAALGKGSLPAERVIMEHYRLGSGMTILSRSFCNTDKLTDTNEIKDIFTKGLKEIREYESFCFENPDLWETNRREAARIIREIAAGV